MTDKKLTDEEIIKRLERCVKRANRNYDTDIVLDLIVHRKAEPADGGGAADAAKTRHGKWIDDRKEIDTVGGVRMRALVGYTCSVCGHSENRKYPFCNCGAKMGEEQECGTWRGEYIWR